MSSLLKRLPPLRLELLGPAELLGRPGFARLSADAERYEQRLSQIQRLRGEVYTDLGALTSNDLDAGHHVCSEDPQRWHVLVVDEKDQVDACISIRFHQATADVDDLNAAQAVNRSDRRIDLRYRFALEEAVQLANDAGLRLSDCGAWAIRECCRRTVAGPLIVNTMYALCELMGSSLSFASANAEKCSSAMLARLGGTPLAHDGVRLPPVYDAAYRKDVGLLTFDTRHPAPRYAGLVRELIDHLLTSTPVTVARVRELSCTRRCRGCTGRPGLKPKRTPLRVQTA